MLSDGWSPHIGFQILKFIPVPTKVRSDQIRSVAQSCPTLCDPMNRSTPVLEVLVVQLAKNLPAMQETLV